MSPLAACLPKLADQEATPYKTLAHPFPRTAVTLCVDSSPRFREGPNDGVEGPRGGGAGGQSGTLLQLCLRAGQRTRPAFREPSEIILCDDRSDCPMRRNVDGSEQVCWVTFAAPARRRSACLARKSAAIGLREGVGLPYCPAASGILAAILAKWRSPRLMSW